MTPPPLDPPAIRQNGRGLTLKGQFTVLERASAHTAATRAMPLVISETFFRDYRKDLDKRRLIGQVQQRRPAEDCVISMPSQCFPLQSRGFGILKCSTRPRWLAVNNPRQTGLSRNGQVANASTAKLSQYRRIL